MPTWTDKLEAWSTLAGALISLVSAILIILSIRQASVALRAQNRSSDTATVISVFERLDLHWIRYKEAKDESAKAFEFGQLTSYYELSCRLFRDRVFQTSAALTLYEHLHDVLTAMQLDADFKRRFDVLRSRPDTFENIRWLCAQPRDNPPERLCQRRFFTVFRLNRS